MPADMSQVLAQVLGQQGQRMPPVANSATNVANPATPPQPPGQPPQGQPNFQQLLIQHLLQMLQLPEPNPPQNLIRDGINGNPIERSPQQQPSPFPPVHNYGGPPRG